MAGLPGAARQVAKVLQRGFELPWQRVLGAGGEIKLRGDSAIEQRLRLEAEGVRFRGRRVDMKLCEFKFAGMTTAKPRSKKKVGYLGAENLCSLTSQIAAPKAPRDRK